jgi:transposase
VSLRFVRELTAPEQAVLNETYKTGPLADLVRRCHAVLLSADGWSVPQLAQLLRVDQATVHRWLDRFTTEGVAGLTPQWSAGRPPIWDETYEWLLVETVRHDPRWYGLAQSLWTCALLAGYLAEQTALHLSSERVRVLLHQHGLHLKQPTPVVYSLSNAARQCTTYSRPSCTRDVRPDCTNNIQPMCTRLMAQLPHLR